MRKTAGLIFIILLQLGCNARLIAQDDFLELDTVSNYNNWGWDALVIKNNYITLAMVPSMGGNILQYDFGVDTCLLLEPRTFGQLYDSSGSPFDNSWGFGGLETWPTPEAWPPPPFLTYKTYTYSTECANADSVVVFLTSEKETTTFPGIQFERRIRVYKNSTHVKIENTMVNHNSNAVNYGFMNVNYVSPSHADEGDYNNFVINFPLNPQSKYKGGVYYDPKSNSFLGETVPGIFSIAFKPQKGKLYADVKEGWASFADKKNHQAYFKVFDVFPGESYPDNGARFEVYVQPSDPAFMAMEVMSPIKSLSANGGKYTFADNLYAAQSLPTVVLKANHAGATFERLNYDTISTILTGSFSVFNKGSIHIVSYDSSHALLQKIDSIKVCPDTIVSINKEIQLPENTSSIEVQAFNAGHEMIGVLDDIDFSAKASPVNASLLLEDTPLEVTLANRQISYHLKIVESGYVSLCLVDAMGRKTENILSGFLGKGEYTNSYPLKSATTGVYVLVYAYRGKVITRKLFLPN
jgi:hypothetical protein